MLTILLLSPAALPAQAIADYSALYQAASPAVVVIHTDDGLGSGFLVTEYGHIATNYHVVRNSRYLAVQFNDGRKVEASVAAMNPRFDMALIKVNSSLVQGIHPLPIISWEREITVAVGVPVVAIGSPADKKFMMTQGILSKVDQQTLLGDYLLQPGSSGGPLLNQDGEVIGINTFTEAGIAGSIRIGTLREFLESPLLAESLDMEPPSRLLPSLNPNRYPVALLNHKIESEPLDPEAYKLDGGEFDITVLTPVLIGKIGIMFERAREGNRFRRRSKDMDASYHAISESYFEWHSSTRTPLDYAVTFDIRPRSGLTTKSKVSRAFAIFLMFGKGKDVEFKAEFADFRIYRDGQLLEPVIPGRALIQGGEEKGKRFLDQAYSGSYVYRPEDFLVGDEFRVEVVDARQPDQVHRTIVLTAESPLIRQLRTDFGLAAEIFQETASQH
jgi:hypothetical protein